MTKQNAKRAYDSAMSQGKTGVAENILIRHPEFKEKPKEETKSKDKK